MLFVVIYNQSKIDINLKHIEMIAIKQIIFWKFKTFHANSAPGPDSEKEHLLWRH